nr:hypothetical protein [Lachnospiraceae bacterium]
MNKKVLGLTACLLLIICAFGCSNEGKTNDDGTETKTIKPSKNEPAYEEVYSDKQLFSIECLSSYSTQWNDDDGLYIYTEIDDSIPYLLVYRYKDMPIDANQLMEESIEPFIAEDYAEQDVSVNPVTKEMIDGKELISISYSYNVGEYRVTARRLLLQYEDDIINFTVKYLDEDQKEITDETLERAVSSFKTYTKKEI